MGGIIISSKEALASRLDSTPGRQADSILIVDDNPDSLYRLGAILLDAGYDVEFAGDGLSAIEWTGIRKFDCILLDVHMPGMNGFEVSTYIRSSELNSETPVIFLTAHNDTLSFSRGFEAGGTDYVTKPIRKSELLARIRAKVDEGKSGRIFRQYLEAVETSNLYVKQSLEYAVFIQNAIMKSSGERRESLPEHFVLSNPRDIISGDFHCFYSNGDYRTVVIMDCTGHGVPGALMSILGVTLCNDIVLNEKITQPDQFLNRLRNRLLLSLGEGRSPELIPDGMEGAVIRYNEKTGQLLYAGSFNPLLAVHRGELVEIRGDRMPIGFSEISRPFSLNELLLEKGDMVYLFTDGYTDQFGGTMNKKFMIRRLRELVLSINGLPVENQKESLNATFIEWKGRFEQTDDVLMLGIRV
jgi:DNA-binding response OmpR family regulator